MNISPQVVRNFLVYAFGGSLGKAVALALMPISWWYLTPADFGLFALCNSFIMIIGIVVAFGLRQILWLEFYHKTSQERRAMVNDIIVLYLALSLPVLGLLGISAPWITPWLFGVYPHIELIFWVTLVHCFFVLFAELFTQVLISQKRTHDMFWITVVSSVVLVIVSLALLTHGVGVLGLLVGQLMSQLFICVIGAWYYHKRRMIHEIEFKRVKILWKQYLFDGFPFIPSLISVWVLNASNRWVLASFCTLTDVGIYATVEMVVTVFQLLLVRPFSQAYVPDFFERCATEQCSTEQCAASAGQSQQIHVQHRRLLWTVLGGLTVLVTVGFFALRSYALIILPLAYRAAVPYTLAMAYSQILYVGVAFNSCYIQFCKKTYFISGSLVVTALINLGLSIIGARACGLWGMMGALLFSSIFYFMLTYWYDRYLQRSI